MIAGPGTPALAVVMPVFNALPHLDEAVQSILDQTFGNFEFVIYDDCSTDGSAERLEEWARRDPRIRLVRGNRNLGPALSSDQVVRLSTAPIVARMDADDISARERLDLQARVLRQNPDVGIVGSLAEVIDSRGIILLGPESWRLRRRSVHKPFPHGSMMFRREIFDAIGGYRKECEFWEDLDFALTASRVTRIFIIPKALYRWRRTPSATRLTSLQSRVENAMDLRYRALDRLREGKDYDDLLEQPSEGEKRVDPRVFLSLGMLALWSGLRPGLGRRFLRRARLRFDLATVLTSACLAWAAVSPRTLGALVKSLKRAKTAVFGGDVAGCEWIEWSPLIRTKNASSPSGRVR